MWKVKKKMNSSTMQRTLHGQESMTYQTRDHSLQSSHWHHLCRFTPQAASINMALCICTYGGGSI